MKIENYSNDRLAEVVKIINLIDINITFEQNFFENGQLWIHEYRQDGLWHSEGNLGPARILWHRNGQVRILEYWQDGLQHRDATLGPLIYCGTQMDKLSRKDIYKMGIGIAKLILVRL